jgi:hypothetical protein
MKKSLKLLTISLPLILVSQMCFASIRNDLPSCYPNSELNNIDVVGRELIVVIDGTFDPDVGLKKLVHAKVQSYIQPNDKISVASFSSYVGEAYTQLRFSGIIEAGIPDGKRSSISKKVLRQVDDCLQGQINFARKSIDDAIKSGFKPAEVEVPKSEIIGNLSRVLKTLLIPSSETAAPKTVLLVSDMLENSDITTFYKHNAVKPINVQSEIKKVKSGGYTTNWYGANVYIMGAGWVHKKYRSSFRGSDVMASLESFWEEYFKLSHATIVEFGQPVLMSELK